MDDLIKLASQLVAIPSMNPMGRVIDGPGYCEANLTAFLESYFRKLDVSFVRQPVAPGRDNIIAWLPDTLGAATLLLEAHQDTVPVDNMTIEPFRPRVDGGRLWGRGACDVKGPMAAMLRAFAHAAIEKPDPRATVVMACVVDEEHEATGVKTLVRETQQPAGGIAGPPWPKPACAIVAEPTELDVVIAHKGVVRWKIVVEGKACHSSDPLGGVSAIYRMAKVVNALERFAIELQTRGSHPLVGPASLSVGRIQGGVSVNTVPDRCEIEIDRRLNPGDDDARAYDEVRQFVAAAPEVNFPFVMQQPWIESPALGGGANGPLAARLQAVSASCGHSARVIGVPFGTDASKIAAAGIPAVVFGPGSIAQAHTADEWIDLKQLRLAERIYFEAIRAFGSPA